MNARLTVSAGVFDLLGQAGSQRPEGFTFYLSGDLGQMSSQEAFLRERGFDVEHSDVYPVLRTQDAERALRAIWDAWVNGWWQYKDKFVELGICTADEFDDRLARLVGKKSS